MPNYGALYNQAEGIVARVHKRADAAIDPNRAARAMFGELSPAEQAAMSVEVTSSLGQKAWADFQKAIGGDNGKWTK